MDGGNEEHEHRAHGYGKPARIDHEAIRILKNLLSKAPVMCYFLEGDKTPNYDGHIELLDDSGGDEENHVPIGQIEVQIKGTTRFSSDPPRYDIEAFYFAYARDAATRPFIFIVVDVEEQEAYWIHLNNEIIKNSGWQQNKTQKRVLFPRNQVLRNGEIGKQVRLWKRIVADHRERQTLEKRGEIYLVLHDAIVKSFSIYENGGIDPALSGISQVLADPRLVSELGAQLRFYDQLGSTYNLRLVTEPGVKADFVGHFDGREVYYDVFSDRKFYTLDSFIKPRGKQGKEFQLARVDKNHQINLYPYRFRACEQCGNERHYILYINPPISTTMAVGGMSESQSIVDYCASCDEVKEVEHTNYILNQIGELYQYVDEEEDYGYEAEPPRDHVSNLDAAIQEHCVDYIKFFEKLHGFLISAVGEDWEREDEVSSITYWIHPLAHLDKELFFTSYDF